MSEVEEIGAKVEKLLLLAKEEKRRKTSTVLSPAEATTMTFTTTF